VYGIALKQDYMKLRAFKTTPLLPLSAMAGLCLTLASAFSAPTEVTLSEESQAQRQQQQQRREEESVSLDRKLWDGSFDHASDQAKNVADQLRQGVTFKCEDHGRVDAAGNQKKPNWRLYQECKAREEAAQKYAGQARSIQKQQRVMSVVSKVSDAAALTAVGGVIYGELIEKKNDQANTYESAANIQKMAGQASYVTGATDLTLGAYAYVAHKRKLEEMQKNLNGGGAVSGNTTLNNSLTGAIEASKKAAYNHMLYGAGKLAVGYASMWAAKRSQEQADNMNSLEELTMLKQLAANQQAATITAYQGGSPSVPYYTNNQPTFSFPTSGDNFGLAANPGAVSYAIPSGGASLAMSGASRAPASAEGAGGKGPGLSGGGGSGAPDSSGASSSQESAADDVKAKSHKEALGSFETSLTGGVRAFSGGGGSSSSSAEETPSLASMMNLGGPADQAKPAATGLSPTQMYTDALEGTEGTEQGSMAGVSGKSETSLFVITKEKLNKMFQVGNVGIPKDVEVKN
jgi:hypothetical protein